MPEIEMLKCEIERLNREKEAMSYKVSQLQQTVEVLREISQQTLELLESHEMLIKVNKKMLEDVEVNLAYEITDPRRSFYQVFPQIAEHAITIKEILAGKSLIRYGDGEFSVMANQSRPPFQDNNQELAGRLEEIIQTVREDVLVAIADNYGDLSKYTLQSAEGIRAYMTKEVRRQHRKILDMDRVYHDAYISRPYFIREDKSPKVISCEFDSWKRIFAHRDVIIVEGRGTRFGVGNDLLDGTSSVRRIICPAKNAFDRYDTILDGCLRTGEENVLYLIALGPTATVLAYDIACNGYQALDIGHLDIEYEWFLAGQGDRVSVKNKVTQENSGDIEDYDENDLREYFTQVIYDFSQ